MGEEITEWALLPCLPTSIIKVILILESLLLLRDMQYYTVSVRPINRFLRKLDDFSTHLYAAPNIKFTNIDREIGQYNPRVDQISVLVSPKCELSKNRLL